MSISSPFYKLFGSSLTNPTFYIEGRGKQRTKGIIIVILMLSTVGPRIGRLSHHLQLCLWLMWAILSYMTWPNHRCWIYDWDPLFVQLKGVIGVAILVAWLLSFISLTCTTSAPLLVGGHLSYQPHVSFQQIWRNHKKRGHEGTKKKKKKMKSNSWL